MNHVYDLMTLQEVAEYMRISRQYLDRIRKNDTTFPEIRLDKEGIRVKFEHLQDWLDKKSATQLQEKNK